MCVCIIRFSLRSTIIHTPTPGPEKESAHDSKRRSRTSENAESIDSQRSVWCMEDTKVAVAGHLDLWPCIQQRKRDGQRGIKGESQNGEVGRKTGQRRG